MHTNNSVVGLESGLPVTDIIHRLRETAAIEGDQRHILSFYLVDFDERRLFLQTGHGSTVHFGEAQLDMSARRVREFLQAGRSLRNLRAIDAAVSEREISWSKAVVLLRVVQIETEAVWLEFATTHSYGDVCEEVRCCRPGDLPGQGNYGLKRLAHTLKVALTDAALKKAELVRASIAEGPDDFVSDTDLFERLLDLAIDQMGLEEDAGLSPAGVRLREDPAEPNHEPIPNEVREHILRRDEHACTNCSCRFDLHVHHLQARADGGSNDAANLLCLCLQCHTSLHRGFLRIQGNPESGSVNFISTLEGKPVQAMAPPKRSTIVDNAARPRRSPAIFQVSDCETQDSRTHQPHMPLM